MDIARRTPDGDTYIPHPAPNSVVVEETPSMGLWSVIKTLIVPALISFILYVLITYVAVPVWKRYRGRYSQYLPLDTLSTSTVSLRQKIQATLAGLLIPSAWRSELSRSQYTVSAQDGSGSDFDEEDGEELYEVESHRREALSLDARRDRIEDGGRLSRDLEEGFKDDSEEEDDIPDERQSRTRVR